MGIPYQCKAESCMYLCCDINGYCPTNPAQCEYFYQVIDIVSPGVIAGISIGAVCVFMILILVVCCLIKRWKKSRE